MDPQVASATFAGLSALAAVSTAGVAAYSLVGSRRDSRDRTRPVIQVTLRRGPAMSHGYVYLEVANVGASMAKYVRVRFEPKLETDDAVATYLVDRYADPIDLIAPGQRMLNVWSNEAAGLTPLPEKVTARVEYRDQRNRSYAESYKLNVAALRKESTANPSGKEYDKRSAKALEALNWELWSR